MANDKIINIATTGMGDDYVKHGAEPVMALIPTAPVPPVAPPAPASAPTPAAPATINK
jgi:hypothetical protein